MSAKLVEVQKSDGESRLLDSRTYRLDPAATLAAIRTELKKKDYMSDKDSFLSKTNSPLDRAIEAETHLSELIGEDASVAVKIGRRKADLGEAATDGNLQRYKSMLADQKISLFSRVEIYRGLTVGADGLQKSPKPALIPLREEQLPLGTRVAANDTMSDHTFNETTRKLMESSVDAGSVSLTTPYGGGEASFEHAKSISTDTKTVNELLIGKRFVQKIQITLDHDDLILTEGFKTELINALKKEDHDGQRAYQLVNVLKKIGFYVPVDFILGGVLLTTETTKVTEWNQVETEKTKFEASVDASYGGIGGTAKASHEQEKSDERGEVNKYTGLKFKQLSGKAVDPDKFDDFVESLEPSINWDVIRILDLCPTLALLPDSRVRNYCFKLLNKYGTYPQLVELQPYIDLIDYSTDAQTTFLQNRKAA